MIKDVGSPDPLLKTSPIAEETDEEFEVLQQEEPGAPACYFNDRAYSHGAFVQSGITKLRCHYGIWLRVQDT